MSLGLLVALENADKVLSNIQRIFNTGPSWGHVLSWPKVGLEPKFHEPGTFGGFRKREQTNTHDSCFISVDFISVCIIRNRYCV